MRNAVDAAVGSSEGAVPAVATSQILADQLHRLYGRIDSQDAMRLKRREVDAAITPERAVVTKHIPTFAEHIAELRHGARHWVDANSPTCSARCSIDEPICR